jgi:hypothetical protein
MSKRNKRDAGIIPSLRRLAAEKIVLPGSERSISWLTLQGIIFFVACVICSCCSLSSYTWGSLPHLDLPILTPRPTQTPTPVLTATKLTETQPLTVTLTSTPGLTVTITITPESTLQPASPIATPTPEPSTPPPTRTSPSRPTPTGTPRSFEATSDVHIAHVEYNPTGLSESDEEETARMEVEQEFITIENQGPGDQDMTGWTINNNKLDTYWFPAGFILRGETKIQVWSRSSEDTETELYWGSEEEIWDNAEGVAYLRDHTGTLVDTLAW